MDPELDEQGPFKLIEGSCPPKRLPPRPGENEVALKESLVELNDINSGKKSRVSGVGPHFLHLRFSLCDKAPNLAADIFVESKVLEFEVIDDIAQSSHLCALRAQKTSAVTKMSELENELRSAGQKIEAYVTTYKQLMSKDSNLAKIPFPT